MQTNSLRLAGSSDPAKNGVSFIGSKKIFWKVVDELTLAREIRGYESVAQYYPVPKLYGHLYLGDGQYALCFGYEESVGEEKGLLVDLFATQESLGNDFATIIQMYRDAFLKTLTKQDSTSSDIFFSDRVRERIPAYYSADFLNTDQNFVFNEHPIHIQPSGIVDDIKQYFSDRQNSWSIVSQCDPNDLNIGTLPVLFDYTAGGYVPLMAEFATLFWYQLAQGSYLAPIYNKEAFKDHQRIYATMDKVSLVQNHLTHIPSDLRIQFLKEYMTQVIQPCLAKIPDDYNWYEEFKNHLAMKILGVFNISKMEKKDMLLSLGYLHLFYTANIPNIEDLFKLID